jgi:hypothetical protein
VAAPHLQLVHHQPPEPEPDPIGPELERLLTKIDRDRDDHANQLWRAMMLAPTLTICRALLAGETVDPSTLNQTWLLRFGRRK